MIYIATFFTHYGAMTFTKKLCGSGFDAKMMPVPRQLSSSCGTGVRFEAAGYVLHLCDEHVDKLFRQEEQPNTFRLEYQNGG